MIRVPTVVCLIVHVVFQELNYLLYLGLRSVVIRVQHARSPRLLCILRKWLWTKHCNLTLVLLYFSSLSISIVCPRCYLG